MCRYAFVSEMIVFVNFVSRFFVLATFISMSVYSYHWISEAPVLITMDSLETILIYAHIGYVSAHSQ